MTVNEAVFVMDAGELELAARHIEHGSTDGVPAEALRTAARLARMGASRGLNAARRWEALARERSR